MVSWLPRASLLLIAGAGAAGTSWILFGERDILFTSLVTGVFLPWFGAVLWGAWRTVPIRSVAIDPASQTATFALGKRSLLLPFSSIQSITLDRGLIAIHSRGSRGRVLLGRGYVFALYDKDLRDFVDCCTQAGLSVTMAWGMPVPKDISSP